jgi:hypothetical protein
MKLTDVTEFNATTFEEAIDLMKMFDENTNFVKVYPEDLKFAVVETVDSNAARCRIVPGDAVTEYGTLKRSNSVELFELNDYDVDLRQEAVKTGVFMFIPGQGFVAMSPEALADIQNFVGVRGDGVASHCPEEIEFTYRLMLNKIPSFNYTVEEGFTSDPTGNSLRDMRKNVKEFYFTVMYREDPVTGVKKVFSVRTGKYLSIAQMNITKVVDAIKMFGNPVMQKFEATHFKTSIYEVYPEVGDQYAKAFNLRDKKVLPGFKIRTSDTGDSSFCIEKYLYFESGNIRFGYVLPADDDRERQRVSVYHYGREKDFEKIKSMVNQDMFITFKKFPERIAALASIGEINIKEGLTLAFQAMKLRKTGSILSEDREKALVEELAKSFGTDTAPAYYVAMAAVTAGDNEELSLSDTQREGLKSRALLVFNAVENFKQIVIGGVAYA